jgi:hypothetical protein
MWQRLVISGVTTGGTSASAGYSQVMTLSNFTVGDNIAAAVRMRIYGSTALGIQGVQISLQAVGSGGTVMYNDGYQGSQGATFPVQDFTDLVLATETIQIPAGVSKVELFVQALIDPAALAIDLTFDFRQASVTKVQ